ncbi:DUF1385 domain-containing protein [Defluviitalea phaphyphila]|uniref:DUF1385 domain-containing protein n=1 Tax=Defluviitalea phaphyphila TaxID=1473580 RepID=UPI000731D27F|nr:DUF1385 domain-containing protein [Defluviitalea phaphyphila]
MKRINVGGQAVIEGVMMRGTKSYSVAVRKLNKEIVVDKKPVTGIISKYSIFKLPILRGIATFIDSMIIGIKTLTYSAEFFEVEDEKPSKFENYLKKKFGDKLDDYVVGFSIFIAILLGIALFMVSPFLISRLFRNIFKSIWIQNTLEGFFRIAIFLTYIYFISKMKDIQRVFEYHGAEHKTINCLEHEEELTIENVRKHSRLHKSCGTSFLLIVILISVFVFIIFNVENVWMRFFSRIIFVPLIAGISYEVIRWARKSNSKLANIISIPGMWLQRVFTTREPDDEQIEVAIVALERVLEDEENY